MILSISSKARVDRKGTLLYSCSLWQLQSSKWHFSTRNLFWRKMGNDAKGVPVDGFLMGLFFTWDTRNLIYLSIGNQRLLSWNMKRTGPGNSTKKGEMDETRGHSFSGHLCYVCRILDERIQMLGRHCWNFVIIAQYNSNQKSCTCLLYAWMHVFNIKIVF